MKEQKYGKVVAREEREDGHTYSLRLDYAAGTAAGADAGMPKQNQDTYIFREGMGDARDTMLFAVFDGHGRNGAKASSFVRQWLPQHLAITPGMSGGDLVKGVHGAFTRTSSDLLKQPDDFTLSGTTCCAMALREGKLMVANVGDSWAISGVYIKGQGVPDGVQELTRDHKPTIPGEHARIEACGGEVKPLMVQDTAYGPDRVWMKGQETPGLCMSRSIGDKVGQLVGVVPDPDVTVRPLQVEAGEELHMVLGTDGIYDFQSNEAIVDFLHSGNLDVREACHNIILQARQQWVENEDGSIDDCSAIVVRLYWEQEPKAEAA